MSKYEWEGGDAGRPATPHETTPTPPPAAQAPQQVEPGADPQSAGEEPRPRSFDQAMDMVDRLQEQLAAKTVEAAALKDRLLRDHADLENFKRRMQREKSDALRYASEQLLRDLLPVIDNLQRAIDAAGAPEGDPNAAPRVEGLVTGVKMVLHQFAETLSRFGVTRVESAGKPFDPSHHEAVAHVETMAQPPGSVVDEYVPGYRLHERLLRPAQVTVAKRGS